MGDAFREASLVVLTSLLGGPEEREPIPTPPSIERPALVFGLPLATVALLGVGALLLFKFAK